MNATIFWLFFNIYDHIILTWRIITWDNIYFECISFVLSFNISIEIDRPHIVNVYNKPINTWEEKTWCIAC